MGLNRAAIIGTQFQRLVRDKAPLRPMSEEELAQHHSQLLIRLHYGATNECNIDRNGFRVSVSLKFHARISC